MKNLNKIIGLFVVGLVISCNEDFLVIPSKTDLSTATFFKTQDDFERAVNGTYEPLRGLYNSGGNGQTGQYVMGEMHSDNSYYIYNPGFRATIDAENIADLIYDPASGSATFKYRQNYLIISRANQVLAAIDGITFDDAAVKSNLKGQGLFLRALAYFDLVQYFGSVPLHLEPAKSLSDVALPIAGVDEIYQQIIADATDAASMLPNKTAQEAGRATSGATKTLLGNVYIVRQDYASAESVLKEVVTSSQYQLLGNYEDVFDPVNKNNSESVFEIQYLEGPSGYQSSFIYTFLPQPISAADLTTLMANYGVTVANVPSLAFETYNTPTPDLIASYEPGDLREDATIGYGSAGGTTYPFILKYLHPHALGQNTNENWPVYRYSEVLLLLAEALNAQGGAKSTEALTYLNMVRNRAGLGNVTSTTNLDQVIMHERRVELAFENKRWTDLVRKGQVQTVMSAFGAAVLADPQSYYFPAGQGPVSDAFQDFRTTFPLPADESTLSPYF